MSNFHRPRVYRSVNGCCICGAKSSSSRFTSSHRYEQAFAGCFGLVHQPATEAMLNRTGDICNACVLLVKRWKKLPHGSSRNWKHVVDARVGGGCKVPGSKARKFGRIDHRLMDTDWNDTASPGEEGSIGTSDEDTDSEMSLPPPRVSSFLDVTYWKQTKVCCGTIFSGANGEVLLDMRLWRPCVCCRRMASGSLPEPDETAADNNSDDSLLPASSLDSAMVETDQ